MAWPDNGTFPLGQASVFSDFNFGSLPPHGEETTQVREENDNVGVTLNGGNQMTNNPDVENSSSRSKKRKLKSKVWDDFTKIEEDGKEWAVCNHCKKKFVGSSKSGTTHLKNHLASCQAKRNLGGSVKAYKSADQTGTNCSTTTTSTVCEHCGMELVRSSQSGSSNLLSHLARHPAKRNPGESVVAYKSADQTGTNCLTTTTSANVIRGKSNVDRELNQLDARRMRIKDWVPLYYLKDDILEVFEEEKEKLRRYFDKLSCRFNLFIENNDYVSAYFIDDKWELKKKVIYLDIETECNGREFRERVKSCLFNDWNIGEDICSIVVNRDFLDVFEDNDDETKEWVSERGSLALTGTFISLRRLVEFLHDDVRWEVRCELGKSPIGIKVWKLNEYVRKTSAQGSNDFDKVAAYNSTGIILTSQIRLFGLEWLKWSPGLKEAFGELENIDHDFKPFNLTNDEWNQATTWYEILKQLNDIINSLLDCKYKTPNVYFPMICHLHMTVLLQEKSGVNCISKIASTMREKYLDKYWSDTNLIFAITIVLDPRFKLDIVKDWFVKIYDNASDIYIRKVIDEFTNIFNKYAEDTRSSKTSTMLNSMEQLCTYHVDHIASTQSELGQYLKDSKFLADEDFDILAWWKFNYRVYPTLARMARDFLAIPIHVESDFDSSLFYEIERITYDENLDDDIKKALVHTKVWLSS